jgi:hypothetical protein
MRAQRGRQRRAAVEQLARAIGVSGDAADAGLLEDVHGPSEDDRCVERVPRDDGHHDVQLELPGVGRGQDRGVTPDDLAADLIDHFRHRWIHLAGHD